MLFNSGGRDRRNSVSLRPAWSTGQVPRQPKLHRETLSWKKKNVLQIEDDKGSNAVEEKMTLINNEE